MDKYTIAPPAGSSNNSVGAADRPWREGHFDSVKLNGGDLGEYLAESTGYGIVSGCEPSISGLTVTVGAGIVHLADGTRKEITQTSVTLDSADSTNPRIDLVYINADGVVAKVTGTAAASPSAPTLPTGGISVAQVTITAGATTGTVANNRSMLPRWYNTGIVNVKDFGAVGDGVHDDTAAIQEAIDNNSVIFFSKGTYKTTSTITITGKKTLIGSNATILNTTSDMFTTTQGVVVDNIIFVGNGAYDVFSGKFSYGKITNCGFNNVKNAVNSDESWGLVFERNSSWNEGNGIGVLTLAGANRVVISNNNFYNFTGNAITINGGADVVIENNIFETSLVGSSIAVRINGGTQINIRKNYSEQVSLFIAITSNDDGEINVCNNYIYKESEPTINKSCFIEIETYTLTDNQGVLNIEDNEICIKNTCVTKPIYATSKYGVGTSGFNFNFSLRIKGNVHNKITFKDLSDFMQLITDDNCQNEAIYYVNHIVESDLPVYKDDNITLYFSNIHGDRSHKKSSTNKQNYIMEIRAKFIDEWINTSNNRVSIPISKKYNGSSYLIYLGVESIAVPIFRTNWTFFETAYAMPHYEGFAIMCSQTPTSAMVAACIANC